MTEQQKFVEIRHAQKSFGDLEVLKDISLTVERGQIVGSLDHPVRANQRYCEP